MNVRRMRRPSPALVVAMVALLFALGGTAGAVVSAAVPLAKRALVADNAKKLGGQTSAQIVSQAASQAVSQSPAGPRPASTAAGLLSQKTANGQIGAGTFGNVAVSCDPGQKATGFGYSASPPLALLVGVQPQGDTGWSLMFLNIDDAALSVNVFATCLR